MHTLKIFVLGLTFFSCNQPQARNENIVHSDTVVIKDTIANLLDNALTLDSLEINNFKPFLFFKSGHFISKKEKNALIVSCPTDTTYLIKLYGLQDNKWNMNDSIGGLSANPIQFHTTYDDYNFDNQTDIYIQVTASNGYSISYGHLLTIDPLTKKFTEQIEARKLANMQPDIKTKTVISEDVIWCKTNGMQKVCNWTNKWVNEHLKTIKKDCPCESE